MNKEQKIAEIRQKHAMHVYDGYEDNVQEEIGFLLAELEEQKSLKQYAIEARKYFEEENRKLKEKLAQAEDKATSKQRSFEAEIGNNIDLSKLNEGLRSTIDIEKERNKVARDEAKKLREERDHYKALYEQEKDISTQEIKRLEQVIEQLTKAAETALIGAKHESCMRDEKLMESPDPTWHCCDWGETVEMLESALTKAKEIGVTDK